MEIKKRFDEMSVLSPLLFLYTLVYLGMMIGDFAARDKFDMPTGMMPELHHSRRFDHGNNCDPF